MNILFKYQHPNQVDTLETFASGLKFSLEYSPKLLPFGQLEGDVLTIDLGLVVPGQVFTIADGEDELHWFSSDLKRSLSENDVCWSELMDRYILERFAHPVEDGDHATRSWLLDHDFCLPYREEVWWHTECDELVYCEDIEAYAWSGDVYFCEGCDEAHYQTDNQCSRSVRHECVNGYHSTTGCTETLKPESLSSIGYEVEKTKFTIGNREAQYRNDRVGDYPIFRGFETDASCGVEAITHILPLDPSYFGYVQQLVEQAAEIITSPDTRQCGGHMSVSYQGLTGLQLIEKMRGNLSIFYAIYKSRLNTQYCSGNKALKYGANANNYNHGYNVARVKSKYFELRLPPTISSVEDMMMRHKVMSALVEHSIIGSDWDVVCGSLSSLLPHFGDAEEIIALASGFRTWILTDTAPDSIHQYIPSELSRMDRERVRDTRIGAIEERLMLRRRERTMAMYTDQLTLYMLDGSTVRLSIRERGFWVHGMQVYLTLSPALIPCLTAITTDGVRVESWDGAANYLAEHEAPIPIRACITEPTRAARVYQLREFGNVSLPGHREGYALARGLVYSYTRRDTFIRPRRWARDYQVLRPDTTTWVQITEPQLDLLTITNVI